MSNESPYKFYRLKETFDGRPIFVKTQASEYSEYAYGTVYHNVPRRKRPLKVSWEYSLTKDERGVNWSAMGATDTDTAATYGELITLSAEIAELYPETLPGAEPITYLELCEQFGWTP